MDPFWTHSCDLGCQFGPSWVQKGAPKSMILTPRHRKARKDELWEVCLKKLDFLIGILMENVTFGTLKSSKILLFSNVFSWFYEFSEKLEKLRKIPLKGVPKCLQNRRLDAHGVDFKQTKINKQQQTTTNNNTQTTS